MTPEQVPDELIEAASEAWRIAPQKRDGKPTRMRYAVAAVVSALERPDGPAAPAASKVSEVSSPATAAYRPWPRVTLQTNVPDPGRHAVLVDGHDISPACRTVRLLLEPGCWPRLDLELRIHESGGVDADGAEIVLPPETVIALQALGWTPPGPPDRPDSARS